MSDDRYHNFDLPYYKERISAEIPDKILDFHTHIWLSAHWKYIPWETQSAGTKYMVSEENYSIEQLIADGKLLFPDKEYNAVCFGSPSPVADHDKTNAYTAETKTNKNLYPLMIAGLNTTAPDRIREMISNDGFYGYKVFLNWFGNDYGNIRVQDMIGKEEMEIANEFRLIVLLHVPRDGRLADPEIQSGVQWLSKSYPDAKIVLAHCGRAYLPDEMKNAIHSVKGLDNVYFDTAMVMDPLVIERVFDNMDSKRVLFATDLPIAMMRGRRVQVADHWVDLVYEGNPESAFRVQSNNMRATFMVYEIIHAIIRAGEMAGISDESIRDIFYNNGIKLLNDVKKNK